MPTKPKRRVRESLEPKLRLFLSADIVGSTAFKQRSGKDADQWFGLVGSFYMMAERYFAYRWAQAEYRYQLSERPLLFGTAPPELWKTIGDEVLFTKDISHPSEAMMCMSIWLQVLDDLRKLLQKTGSLDLKSTAWLADFPIRNRAILLRVRGKKVNENPSTGGVKEHSNAMAAGAAKTGVWAEVDDPGEDFDWLNDCLYGEIQEDGAEVINPDFIGQSMDTGFRVGTAASARKLMLSVELAHMLSMECEKLDTGPYQKGAFPVRSFTFHYEGRLNLKGVLDGTPYPLIWLDVEPAKRIHVAEDALGGRTKPTPRQIHEFTSALIGEFPNRFCTMLQFLGHKPKDYEDYENEITDAIENLEKKFARLDRSVKLGKRAGASLEKGRVKNRANANTLLASSLGLGMPSSGGQHQAGAATAAAHATNASTKAAGTASAQKTTSKSKSASIGNKKGVPVGKAGASKAVRVGKARKSTKQAPKAIR